MSYVQRLHDLAGGFWSNATRLEMHALADKIDADLTAERQRADAAEKELAAVRRQRDDAVALILGKNDHIAQLMSERDEARREIASLRKDAERYRWLLPQFEIDAVQTQLPLYPVPHLHLYEEVSRKGTVDDIQKAIDAAMEESN